MSAIAIEVESILPKELAWLVTSYIDVPEWCAVCRELWQFRAVRECACCRRICHRACTTESHGAILCNRCTSLIDPCAKCLEPATYAQIMLGSRCRGCNLWYHYTCHSLTSAPKHNRCCSFCIQQQDVSCDFCENRVHIDAAQMVRCTQCRRIECPSHPTSRGQDRICYQCDASRHARGMILFERMRTAGVRLCHDYHVLCNTYESGYRDDLETVAHALCEYEFLSTFCNTSCNRGDEHKNEIIRTAFLALVSKDEPWPWQQGITPEVFRRKPAYQKAVEHVKQLLGYKVSIFYIGAD